MNDSEEPDDGPGRKQRSRARTTKLYDRRNDQVTLDQVERIVL
jgi:hypothetical protein